MTDTATFGECRDPVALRRSHPAPEIIAELTCSLASCEEV
jgi:hypothetical protein